MAKQEGITVATETEETAWQERTGAVAVEIDPHGCPKGNKCCKKVGHQMPHEHRKDNVVYKPEQPWRSTSV